jgi:hypothetical protein
MDQDAMERRLMVHRRILERIVIESTGVHAGVLSLARDQTTLQDALKDLAIAEAACLRPDLCATARGDAVEQVPPTAGIAPRIRPAGPEAMENPPEEWDDIDEASDGSFPASDPPPHA